MAVLVWRHGKARDEAVADVKAALEELGYAKYVTWDGPHAWAWYRFLVVLVDVAGEITEDVVVIERSDGKFGGVLLDRCREVLERVFPGGES